MGTIRRNGTILNGNGRSMTREPGQFEEIGTTGLDIYSGFIQKAYNTELYWPHVEPLYSRIWRSDPEVSVVRTLFDAWASGLDVTIELPEQQGGRDFGDTSDDDRRAQEFGYEVLDDITGGIGRTIASIATRAPFYGWGLWEVVTGIRRQNWQAPNDDPWRSEYNDGLVGIRHLAFRDYSSFEKWEADDRTGRIYGMWQNDPPNPRTLIPLDRALHITYGDHDNPEGMATLEAIWRLERIKYGLEVVMGIGFEHAAGHLSVTAQKKLTTDDHMHIQRAARAIMTAQEGNYAAWPEGFTGEIMDVPFSAATSIREAIQYYSILKLSLLGMQWVALSSMTGAGSFASMKDSSGMAVLLFNSMIGGFEQQINDQLIKRLYNHPVNAAAFPGMTRRPYLKISRLDKAVELEQLAQFVTAMNAVMPLGEDDFIAIRRKSELLPETLPDNDDTAVVEPEPQPAPQPETPEDEAMIDDVEDETDAEMSMVQWNNIYEAIANSRLTAPKEKFLRELDQVKTQAELDDLTSRVTLVLNTRKFFYGDETPMSTTRWWELRAQIYRQTSDKERLIQLVDMLDNAATVGDLDRVEQRLTNGA